MTKHDEHTFHVRGFWPFPHDMLRYDTCYPAHERDGLLLDRLDNERDLAGMVVVELASRSERAAPTHGRWKSRGWTVVQGSREVP